jgi:hypothetical protein
MHAVPVEQLLALSVPSQDHNVRIESRYVAFDFITTFLGLLLAHRALWIRLLRRRSQRKNASAPSLHIARSAR